MPPGHLKVSMPQTQQTLPLSQREVPSAFHGPRSSVSHPPLLHLLHNSALPVSYIPTCTPALGRAPVFSRLDHCTALLTGLLWSFLPHPVYSPSSWESLGNTCVMVPLPFGMSYPGLFGLASLWPLEPLESSSDDIRSFPLHSLCIDCLPTLCLPKTSPSHFSSRVPDTRKLAQSPPT